MTCFIDMLNATYRQHAKPKKESPLSVFTHVKQRRIIALVEACPRSNVAKRKTSMHIQNSKLNQEPCDVKMNSKIKSSVSDQLVLEMTKALHNRTNGLVKHETCPTIVDSDQCMLTEKGADKWKLPASSEVQVNTNQSNMSCKPASKSRTFLKNLFKKEDKTTSKSTKEMSTKLQPPSVKILPQANPSTGELSQKRHNAKEQVAAYEHVYIDHAIDPKIVTSRSSEGSTELHDTPNKGDTVDDHPPIYESYIIPTDETDNAAENQRTLFKKALKPIPANRPLRSHRYSPSEVTIEPNDYVKQSLPYRNMSAIIQDPPIPKPIPACRRQPEYVKVQSSSIEGDRNTKQTNECKDYAFQDYDDVETDGVEETTIDYEDCERYLYTTSPAVCGDIHYETVHEPLLVSSRIGPFLVMVPPPPNRDRVSPESKR